MYRRCVCVYPRLITLLHAPADRAEVRKGENDLRAPYYSTEEEETEKVCWINGFPCVSMKRGFPFLYVFAVFLQPDSNNITVLLRPQNSFSTMEQKS